MTQDLDFIFLSGGCFWGMEDLLSKLKGVVDTEVGYTGGYLDNPKYDDVKTGHVETVKVNYDKNLISLAEILHFYFKIHNPTTVNQQGNDIGSQYRSVIFIKDSYQKKIAEQIIIEVNNLNRFDQPIVTTIEPFEKFYSAENYHQDYLKKYPDGYTCHFIRK